MKRIRAFVAFELSPNIRKALRREIDRLGATGADVRWVAERNIHLTLKFLGPVESDRLGDVSKALARAAADVEPFGMEVSGLAFFPKPVRPKVLAAGVDPEGAEALAGLAGRIEDAMLEVGFDRENRGFKSHITLGRVCGTHGIGALAEELLIGDGAPFGRQMVEEVALYMSELSRDGPSYTVLAKVPLGG